MPKKRGTGTEIRTEGQVSRQVGRQAGKPVRLWFYGSRKCLEGLQTLMLGVDLSCRRMVGIVYGLL